MRDSFKDYCANPNNPKWGNMIKREKELYSRKEDIRSEFERDHNRIINTTGYRRMKHKTQVFFSPTNDHICTRIEHVTHVESISYTIANYLGLNTELTKAIATAHDIGHSPFGHAGERILSEISLRDIGETFWHEKNGVDMVDKIELLADNRGDKQNLNLTYAVRDGIISHCGEIDENFLMPRDEAIDLKKYTMPNQYAPYTWEGCVVKIADKISYLGRDIQDAIILGILDENLEKLYEILNANLEEPINNTVLINNFVYDLCVNSSPEKGMAFSEKAFEMINQIKKFNYNYIYFSGKRDLEIEYFKLIINTIYNTLKQLRTDKEKILKLHTKLASDFNEWLSTYWNLERKEKQKNDVIFNMQDEKDFCKAIIYYISGMTDNYAIDMYNRIVRF